MASLPLTLAALATSAVPGLTAVAVRSHGSDEEFAAAILTTDDDEIIISVPRNSQAETKQSAAVLGLTALTDGARSELPFAVPSVLGLTRAGETRAVATTFLPGARFNVSDLEADALLVPSIAVSIAAIHSLPRSIAQQGGLPDRSARDQRLLVTRVVDRAAATRFLPSTVQHRWTEVLEATELWDFEPQMVHGTLSDETLLVEDDRVVGVLDWSGCAVGDVAADLAWLLGAGDGVFEEVLREYANTRDAGSLQALRARATLYHELEIAHWLLHGVDTHDQSIIDDAVGMLDHLVDRLSILDAAVPERAHLSEAEAVELLEHTPEVVDRMSDTAAYEALDEDRMFEVDGDFADDKPAGEGPSETEPAESASAEVKSAQTEQPVPIDEQLTQPIDDADLPPRASSQRPTK